MNANDRETIRGVVAGLSALAAVHEGRCIEFIPAECDLLTDWAEQLSALLEAHPETDAETPKARGRRGAC